MADAKTTALSEISVPAFEDLAYLIDDVAGTPTSVKVTLTRLLGMSGLVPGGRLTLTTAVPITTSDVTAAGTLYYTPYLHGMIRIFDGTRWRLYTFTERSLSLTLTSGKPYDIFIYDNSGTLTLEALVWTNDTTRATALVRQDGVLVKTGATTRLYLGTIYASGTNTTEDSLAKRFVWNAYNQVPRFMRVTESTDSWSYSTNTYRQARATATNQLDYVCGDAATDITARALGMAQSSSAIGVGDAGYVGVGIDSTSVNSAQTGSATYGGSGVLIQTLSQYEGYPGVGRHFVAWLEAATTNGTTTWFGDNGGSGDRFQSGICGRVMG